MLIKPSTGGDPEKGARNDGKGFAELANTSNEDAAKKISSDMSKKNSRDEIALKRKNKSKKVVVEKTRRKPVQPELRNKQRRMAEQKAVENRVPTYAHVKEIEAIRKFVEKLDPETQALLKEDLKKKLSKASEKTRAEEIRAEKIRINKNRADKTRINKNRADKTRINKNRADKIRAEKTRADKARASNNTPKEITTREIVDQKRGIHKRQTALQMAKEVAEKARQMLKDARNRILGRKRTTSRKQDSANIIEKPARQQQNASNIRKKSAKKQKFVNARNNNKGRE